MEREREREEIAKAIRSNLDQAAVFIAGAYAAERAAAYALKMALERYESVGLIARETNSRLRKMIGIP
jgi:hypothetical protein